MEKLDNIIQSLINNCSITGLSQNSKKIKPGFLFAAFQGTSTNGEDYITEAIANGARYILLYGELEKRITNKSVDYFYVPEPRKYFAKIASWIFPNIPTKISAVTGTNGKTSVVNFANQIVHLLNVKSASIGTLGVIKKDFTPAESLTTPLAEDVCSILTDLKTEGIDNVFIEASSQGLAQSRIHCLPIQSAVITNVGHDHLDYHRSMENYINAKLKLFTDIAKDNFIIHKSCINLFNETILKNKNIIVYLYSEKSINTQENYTTAFIGIDHSTNYKKSYEHIFVQIGNQHFKCKTQILSSFQLENLLAAILMVYSHGFELDDIMKIIPLVMPLKGRMDLIHSRSECYSICIDYAHNVEGLKTVITSLLKHYNKIITVFGCGGGRDKSKRPVMGKIASSLSYKVILTNDNPRFENPEDIISEIISGIDEPYKTEHVYRITDRKSAINKALDIADSETVVLIAGKGIESYQIIKNNKIYYSDYDTVNALLEIPTPSNIQPNIFHNFSLAKISRLRIGGEIKSLFIPENIEQLILFIKKHKHEKFYIFGACSNLLISDQTINLIGIKLSKLNKIYTTNSPITQNAEINNNASTSYIIAEAGAFGSSLANFAKNILSAGFEFLLGIPGTIGGGIFMNAGCFGDDYKKILLQVECIDIHSQQFVYINANKFQYRNSMIPNNYIITRGLFKITPTSNDIIAEKENFILNTKNKNQPSGLTCGSTFKNPPNISAWKLIQEVGLGNLKVGGVYVSEQHSNFLINDGTATFNDFQTIIHIIQNTVRKKTNLDLELEIKILE